MLPYFEVFGLQIPLFGLMMMLGILAGIALTFYTRRFIPFTEDQVLTALIWTILGGFIGSKLTYWCVEFKRILADPSFLLHSLREGFVLYGSLIGGVIGCIIYTRKNKLPTIAMFDLIAPSFAIGQAFGRIGCFCAATEGRRTAVSELFFLREVLLQLEFPFFPPSCLKVFSCFCLQGF